MLFGNSEVCQSVSIKFYILFSSININKYIIYHIYLNIQIKTKRKNHFINFLKFILMKLFYLKFSLCSSSRKFVNTTPMLFGFFL